VLLRFGSFGSIRGVLRLSAQFAQAVRHGPDVGLRSHWRVLWSSLVKKWRRKRGQKVSDGVQRTGTPIGLKWLERFEQSPFDGRFFHDRLLTVDLQAVFFFQYSIMGPVCTPAPITALSWTSAISS
jgi:hypothetical protein